MDYGHEQADKMLKELEAKIYKEYQQAALEVEKSMNEYLKGFYKNDTVMRMKLDSELISEAEYLEWRKKQTILTERWKTMREELTETYMKANEVASQMTLDHRMDVYALNYNYGTYEVEMGARLNTSFTLYNRDTVIRLMKDDPKLLPDMSEGMSKKVREGKLRKWNEKELQSVMTQSMLQGESVPKISKRLAEVVGEKNMASAVRAARTMTTSSENGARLDSYFRAESMGIKMGKTWMSAHDGRVRKSHRELDGETVPIKEPFSNDLMFPADPSGAPEEVYNCRCTMVADVISVDGVDISDITASYEGGWDMDFEEWIEEH